MGGCNWEVTASNGRVANFQCKNCLLGVLFSCRIIQYRVEQIDGNKHIAGEGHAGGNGVAHPQ